MNKKLIRIVFILGFVFLGCKVNQIHVKEERGDQIEFEESIEMTRDKINEICNDSRQKTHDNGKGSLFKCEGGVYKLVRIVENNEDVEYVFNVYGNLIKKCNKDNIHDCYQKCENIDLCGQNNKKTATSKPIIDKDVIQAKKATMKVVGYYI